MRMADQHREAPTFCQTQRAIELVSDRLGLYHVIEKHITGDDGHARRPRTLLCHGFIGGTAVEKE